MVTIAEVREKAKRQLEEARKPKDDLLGKVLGGLGSGVLAYLTGGLANAAIGGLAGAGIPVVSGAAQAAQGIGSGIAGATSAVPGAKEVLSAAPGAAESGPAWFKPGSETLLSALEAGGKGFMDPSKSAEYGIAGGLEEPISTARSNIKQTAVREAATKLGLTPKSYGKDGATYDRPDTTTTTKAVEGIKKKTKPTTNPGKDMQWVITGQYADGDFKWEAKSTKADKEKNPSVELNRYMFNASQDMINKVNKARKEGYSDKEIAESLGLLD